MHVEHEGRLCYGRTLIEEALGYALNAKTEFVFGEDGVSCRVELPLGAKTAGVDHMA